MVTILDSADVEHLHHQRQFYWTAPIHTAENPEDVEQRCDMIGAGL